MTIMTENDHNCECSVCAARYRASRMTAEELAKHFTPRPDGLRFYNVTQDWRLAVKDAETAIKLLLP